MRRLHTSSPGRLRSLRRVITPCLLGLLCLVSGAAPSAQQEYPQQSGPVYPRPRVTSPFSDADSADPIFEARRLKALNEHRQKMVVSDTEKLLLATQHLQHEIEEQHASSLTPVELRELSDIEKLARNIRANMADLPGGGSPMMNMPGLQR
jgi:hypothetical protein